MFMGTMGVVPFMCFCKQSTISDTSAAQSSDVYYQHKVQIYSITKNSSDFSRLMTNQKILSPKITGKSISYFRATGVFNSTHGDRHISIRWQEPVYRAGRERAISIFGNAQKK